MDATKMTSYLGGILMQSLDFFYTIPLSLRLRASKVPCMQCRQHSEAISGLEVPRGA